MHDKIRIGVVDIYPIFREGVVQAIGRAEHMTVIAEGSSAEEAKRIAPQCHVLLLEAAVPGSLNIVEAILRSSPGTKVVFLSAVQDDEHASRALQLGVFGYLTKGVTGTDLVAALTAINLGKRQIESELAWNLLTQRKAVVSTRREPLLLLSPREQQVLDYTSKGLTNQQMARILGLSISTIKRFKTSLFRRMGVRNRLAAVVAAKTQVDLKA